MSPSAVYWFGPFRLDPCGGRLLRETASVEIPARLLDLLAMLASHPGELLTKEALLSTLWPDVVVTENALTRAIADLRQVLGDSATSPAYIQTVPRRGYRFISSVRRIASDAAAIGGGPAADPLGPYRAWAEGRLHLEMLSRAALPHAVADFERAVALAPRDALAHAGLANARFLQYEETRGRNRPEQPLLQAAIEEARAACALDPLQSEAWATLAFILVSAGRLDEASAAARYATTLQPGSWRHELRLGHATWGDERLRALGRAIELFRDFPFAYFLAAMVHIARRAWPAAHELIERGAALQDRQSNREARFAAAGLHWLQGLVRLAQSRDGGDPAAGARDALRCFEREIACEARGGLYAIEFAVNAWHAAGCVHLAHGEPQPALEAFGEALRRFPSHARSHLGAALALEAIGRTAEAVAAREALAGCLDELRSGGRGVEAAIVGAAALAAGGRAAEAGAALESLLTAAPPGFAGWTIPVEPMLAVLHGQPAFDRVLTILAERAA